MSSALSMSTVIEQWKNNRKGTLYMWANRSELWASYQDDFVPDEIEVRGKHETHTWRLRGEREKEVDGVMKRCTVYIPKNTNTDQYYWLPDLYVTYD
jgi:hypothetical protein